MSLKEMEMEREFIALADKQLEAVLKLAAADSDDRAAVMAAAAKLIKAACKFSSYYHQVKEVINNDT